MTRIMTILLAAAAILLILPAMLLGSYGYALAVAAVSVLGVVLLRMFPQSSWSNLLLVTVSAVAVASAFLGIHPFYSITALSLSICAWNAGHRFKHFDKAPVERRAKRRFIRETLVFAFVPSIGGALLLSAFLYVRLPLTFGVGLGLSTAVLLVIALFIGLAHAARRQEDDG